MKIPYGYNQGNLGAITVNQDQAAIVNLIYDLYLEGKSLGGIVEVLDERSIPKRERQRTIGDAIEAIEISSEGIALRMKPSAVFSSMAL